MWSILINKQLLICQSYLSVVHKTGIFLTDFLHPHQKHNTQNKVKTEVTSALYFSTLTKFIDAIGQQQTILLEATPVLTLAVPHLKNQLYHSDLS